MKYKKIIPYGLRKSGQILGELPGKFLLIFRLLNPFAWYRLTRQPYVELKEKMQQDAAAQEGDATPAIDPMRPPQISPERIQAWHLTDAAIGLNLKRTITAQRLILLLGFISPLLFVLAIRNATITNTYSPVLIGFNFFVFFILVIFPTYIRLTLARLQLEKKRLVKLSELRGYDHWF